MGIECEDEQIAAAESCILSGRDGTAEELRKILEIGDWSLERVRLKLRLASFSKTYGTAESRALPQSIKRLRKMAAEL
jgi:hypothetical protein